MKDLFRWFHMLRLFRLERMMDVEEDRWIAKLLISVGHRSHQKTKRESPKRVAVSWLRSLAGEMRLNSGLSMGKTKSQYLFRLFEC